MISRISDKSPTIQELYRKALGARTRSYSPYSRFKVGAAVRLANGQIFSGCNVENSSYGATACAEQVTIQKAVSEHGALQIAELMIVSDAKPFAPPCGICLQVISEFAENDIPVFIANTTGEVQETSFRKLYPILFSSTHLPKI